MKTVFIWVFVLGSTLLFAPTAYAHGGGLNSEGCHNQRSNGTYHCHRGTTVTLQAPSRSGPFANCSAARAAGYWNIRVGTYGYGGHLDRDSDGIACER